MLLPNARSFTALVALHDIEKHMGPTRFVLSTHSGFKGEASHNLLENDKSVDGRGTVAARTGPSVLSLLKDGEASLFDSRILHCGGPHEALDTEEEGAAGPSNSLPAERVVFTLSFRHAHAAEVSNSPCSSSRLRILTPLNCLHPLSPTHSSLGLTDRGCQLNDAAVQTLSNMDKHGAGSVRPEVAAMKLRLGQLR